MVHASGHNGDTQWFDYKPGFRAATARVTWPLGSRLATAPGELADALIRGGDARVMTQDEARTYNGEKPYTPTEPKPTMSERDIPQTPQPPLEDAVEEEADDEEGQGADTL